MTDTPKRPPDPTIRPGKDPPKRGAFVAMVVLAFGLIMPWEGLVNSTYIDIVGVATVCYGQTGAAAAPGAHYTDAQCADMLGKEVAVFARQLDRCIATDARMTPLQQAAVLSWAYNIGWYNACSSTLVRQINSGQPAAVWCQQLLRWDKAGKPPKPVRGLTNRRKAEYQQCIAA
jgi:lysozyme